MSEEDTRWLEKLGLERDPFPESETPIDFFSRGGREKQMDALADTTAGGPPLIAVIGESGVGKSTFFHALLRRLPAETRIARVTAGVFLSSKALLQAIARAMGVTAEPEEASSALRVRLHDELRALMEAGTPCVVMVDDAGELEADALDELVQIAELAGGTGALRVILFAMPGVRDALTRAAGAQRVDPIVQEMMLDRYSLNELRGYLQFRLARAGLKSASPFTEEDYQEIFRRSGGLPGRANGVAARLLRNRRAGLGPEKIKWIAGGVAGALLVGGLLILLFSGGGEAEVTGAQADGTLAHGTLADRAEASGDRAAPPLPVLVDAPVGEAMIAADAATTSAESAAPAAATVVVDSAVAGAWMPVTEEIASANPARGQTASATGAAGAGAPAPAPAPSPAASGGDTRVAPAARPAPARSPAAVTGAATPEDTARRELLAIAPGHYTLQVLVNSSAQRTREWIAERPQPERYRYYRRERDGAPQYVTLYGDFADRAAATRASEQVGGFPRSMADVHKDL